MRSVTTLTICCALTMAGSPAFAQNIDSTDPTVDVQLFYPTPGATGFFSVESGDVNPHKGISSGLMLNYARKPLSIKIIRADESQEDVGTVIDPRLDIDLFASYGLYDWGDIGIVLPMVTMGGLESSKLTDVGVGDVGSLTGFSVGDLRLIPKLRAWTYEEGLVSVAVVPTIILPTGSSDWAGENGVVIAPSVAVSSRMGPMRGAVNLGYRMRDRTKVQTLLVDDEVFFKAAGAFDVQFGRGSPFEVIGELHGHTPAGNGFGMGTTDPIKKEFQKARTALEADVGVRVLLMDMLLVSGGVGGGLLPGTGAPQPRIFASVAYATGIVAADQDKDGVIDDKDKCIDEPEDIDQFEDEDGCPDLDNDQDNIVDEDDQCPLEAEDKDGHLDDDGCPEPDNDEDGLLDASDSCPTDPEDKDGFQDEDGCPDPDNDEDGILDTDDKCPLEVEDKDGFYDLDGCPDPDNDGDGLADLNDLCPNHAEDKDGVADDDGCPEDNDGDGIPDEDDKCPNKPESYNGIEDEDGCPEALKAKSLVNVTEEKIEIKEKVFFKTNSAKILPKSHNLLNQVASVLKNYKHIKKVRVEGHTDSVGPKKRNQKLSQQRAESVRQYLIDQGVDPGRLDAEGFGPDKPIASNKTRRGREQNRRVEFVIVEMTAIGKDVGEDQPKPEEPPADEGIELNLEVPAPGEDAPTEEAPPPTEDAPMFEVGPEDAGQGETPSEDAPAEGSEDEPAEEKPAEEGGEIEFNF